MLRERVVLREQCGAVQGLAFRAHDATLVSGYADGTLALWHVPDGEALQRPGTHPGPLKRLAASADGQVLVSAGPEGVWWWDIPNRTGHKLARIGGGLVSLALNASAVETERCRPPVQPIATVR